MEPRYTQFRQERAAQLRQLTAADLAAAVRALGGVQRLPRIRYHFAQHGRDLGATSIEEYDGAFRLHLAQADLRIFSYLRARDRVPFWELVDPVNGRTVLYNEEVREAWSFFQPSDPAAPYRNAEGWWVEVVPGPTNWQIEEQWRWHR